MKDANLNHVDVAGLSAAEIWVRRIRSSQSLADEAVSLAQVLHTWNFNETMNIDQYDAVYAEISGPNLLPTWVYLIQLIGCKSTDGYLFSNHPLSQVKPGEEVRITAIVQPPTFLIPGALVETPERRRMIWLQLAQAR